MIRAIIAEDQAVVRAGFVSLLATQDDIDLVGEAEDGAAAVRIARELRPDVVLLDIRMPVMNGIEAAARILAAPECTSARVLMLTTFGLDEYVYDALAAGASGFLLKDATFPELLHAVRVVAAGDALLAPAITKRLIAAFNRRRPVPGLGPGIGPAAPGRPPLGDLTARETEVLVLIAQGLANDEIGEALSVTGNTVKTHINRLFAKTGLRDRAQAVILAYETGLVRPEAGGGDGGAGAGAGGS